MVAVAEPLNVLSDLMGRATRAGANAADAVYFDAASISVAQRLGASEKLERAESCDLGLRVFIGKRQAIVSSTDFAPETLDELVERAVAMARIATEDPYCGIADPSQLITNIPALDMCDPSEPTAEDLTELATRAEDAARAIDGVTNSDGGEAGWSRANIAVAATNGFAQAYSMSSQSFSACVIAGEDTGMERDYDYDSAVYGADLKSPEDIGRSAGERAVKRLNARRVESQQAPIIYDRRVSSGLVRHLTGAINGASIARGTSFLKDSMGQAIFGSEIAIIDDPHRMRGLRSKPFDGEGIANSRRALVENGKLTTWVLDLASSRQLGLETTGHASRGTSSPPSPGSTNVYMENGSVSLAELMSDIKSGLYITEMIGMGVNGVTGDYSRGATGFWIENGELTFPVTELTVAGNLKDMFLHLTPADDLEFKFGIDAPTLRIDGMTVAGL
jgi:PmbA protein